MDFCIYDDILVRIRNKNKNLLHFKLSKSGQILHDLFSQARSQLYSYIAIHRSHQGLHL